MKLILVQGLQPSRCLLYKFNFKKSICQIDNYTIQKENSEYSKTLYNLPNADFTSIRNIAYKYIQSIGDPIELYNNLQRGEKIIDDERLLYKYLVSFGNKHNACKSKFCPFWIGLIRPIKPKLIK